MNSCMVQDRDDVSVLNTSKCWVSLKSYSASSTNLPCEAGDLFFGTFSLALIALSYGGKEQRVVSTILGLILI